MTFGGEIAEKGVEIDVNIYAKDTLNRFVVKSEWAVVTIPEIELEIPKTTQKGSIKTIEGYLRATADHLKLNQEERRITDPDSAMKIDEFIEKLEEMCLGMHMPWHFKIDDPSGNSFVQNPHAPANDVYCKTKHYERSNKDMVEMGFMDPDRLTEEEKKEIKTEHEEEAAGDHKETKKPDLSPEEVEAMMKKAREVDAKKEERKYDDDEHKEIVDNEVFRIPMP